MIREGADVDARARGEKEKEKEWIIHTPLCVAIQLDHDELVEFLIEEGATGIKKEAAHYYKLYHARRDNRLLFKQLPSAS